MAWAARRSPFVRPEARLSTGPGCTCTRSSRPLMPCLRSSIASISAYRSLLRFSGALRRPICELWRPFLTAFGTMLQRTPALGAASCWYRSRHWHRLLSRLCCVTCLPHETRAGATICTAYRVPAPRCRQHRGFAITRGQLRLRLPRKINFPGRAYANGSWTAWTLARSLASWALQGAARPIGSGNVSCDGSKRTRPAPYACSASRRLSRSRPSRRSCRGPS